MGNMFLLNLANAAYFANKKRKSSSRNSASDFDQSQSDASYSEKKKRYKEDTYLDYICGEIHQKDGILRKFFDKIYAEADKQYQEHINDPKRELILKQIAEKREEIETTAKRLGTTLYSYPDSFTLVSFAYDIETLFKYEKNDHISVESAFLNRISEVKKEIKNIIGECDSVYSFKRYTDKKINRLYFLYKIKLALALDFPKTENDMKLERKKIEEVEEKQCVLEQLENLYNNHKEELQSLFDGYTEYAKLCKEEKALPYKDDLSRDCYGKRLNKTDVKYQNHFFEQALESIAKSKQFLTELKKVFYQMDKAEILGRRGEYSSTYGWDLWNYDRDDISYLLPLVKLFIKNIYETDEEFVDRNLNLLDEESKSHNKKR